LLSSKKRCKDTAFFEIKQKYFRIFVKKFDNQYLRNLKSINLKSIKNVRNIHSHTILSETLLLL